MDTGHLLVTGHLAVCTQSSKCVKSELIPATVTSWKVMFCHV